MCSSNNFLIRSLKKLASPLIQEYVYLKGLYLYNSIADKRKLFNVMSDVETIDYIVKHSCSISRFGDGEFAFVVAGRNNTVFNAGFQQFNSKLAEELGNILSGINIPNNLLVCVPALCFKRNAFAKFKKRSQAFWSYCTYNMINDLANTAKRDYLYGDANLTRFYINIRGGGQRISYTGKLKTIWEGRDIVFVEGNLTHLGYGNDLFSNAKSIRRILCPNKNAWDCYDDILSTVISHTNNDTLIIIALGMTATVLAADLAKVGRQALDLGHIDIEYEWMKMGATEKVPIPGKYVNEAKDGDKVSTTLPDEIQQQIIAIVGI